MANTAELLTLMGEFPNAFTDPESLKATSHTNASHQPSVDTQKLLDLMQSFPEAFADPDTPTAQPVDTQSSAQPQSEIAADHASTSVMPPAGYSFALQRQFSTFTWGTISVSLNYGSAGLQSIWVVVGKSGTETQSLCEGICRLANLLLTQNVPVSAIARELRGIRGADSEGLGSNRILGLADLIGKALQEAPETVDCGESKTVSPTVDLGTRVAEPPAAIADVNGSKLSDPLPSARDHSGQHGWTNLSDHNHRMGICPECGSELQAANGCSGGACLVCGYSSCS
jgi:hypothetical protein